MDLPVTEYRKKTTILLLDMRIWPHRAMSNTDPLEGIYLEAKMHIKKDILLKYITPVLPLMSTGSCTNSTVAEACRDEISAFIGVADLLV
ncbi:hypothetical protein Tco_0948464 [Tanacetum coccineum]